MRPSTLGLLRLRAAGRRHEPAAQLPDDRLEDFRVLRDRLGAQLSN